MIHFFNDLHPTLKADYILANPSPLTCLGWGRQIGSQDDKRWIYGVPPAGNANFAWVAAYDLPFVSQG